MNIGVVVACPSTGYFNFKLQQKRRHGRVTDFFPDVGKDIYREAIEMFSRELSRVQGIVSGCYGDANAIRALYDALIHPREALIQFSESRVRFATDPDAAVPQLFSYYVERSFVTPDYREQKLEQRVRRLIQDLRLPKPFRALEVGDEFATAHFPLVQQDGDIPIKAIKTFLLDQPDPAKIITHGGFWVDRLRRMKSRQTLPRSVLFAIEGPSRQDEKRYSAYSEIVQDFQGLGIITVPPEADNEIVEFAVQ